MPCCHHHQRARHERKGAAKLMAENRLSSISKADSDEKIGEFWDTHDFTEFDTGAADVHFEIDCAVPVEVELFSELEEQANERGVKVETLVNLWLQQKLEEEAA
jgi:CopG antitoxin of type II toxin-antitoxin system